MSEFANCIHTAGENSKPAKLVELPELVAYQAFGQEVNRFGALLYVRASWYFQLEAGSFNFCCMAHFLPLGIRSLPSVTALSLLPQMEMEL